MARTRSKIKLSDIADRAMVSVPAVSMALADHPRISLKTKRRVWQISEELGYHVPTAFRRGEDAVAARKIGFACHDLANSAINSAVMMRLTALASRAGIAMETFSYEDSNDRDHNTALIARFASQLDGLILTGYVDQKVVDAIARVGTPMVVLGDPVAGAPADHVTYDFTECGKQMTRFVLAADHRRVAFLCELMVPGSANMHWHEGYVLAHYHAGLPVAPELTVVIDEVAGKEVYRRTPNVLRQLLAMPDPPTALVTPNPYVAEVLAHELRDRPAIAMTSAVWNAIPPALAQTPLIVLSLDALAEHGFRRLLYLCRNPQRTPLRVIIPFERSNFG